MRACLYARYSPGKDQRDTSITDQFYNGERIADRFSFPVVMRFEDKAITGTNRLRPGYQAMLAAARREEFDVLIVDELSRLSRDNIETQSIIREFKFLRIRVIGVSDGFDSNDKSYKLQAAARGMVNDTYIDGVRVETHRGLSRQARKGKSTGGSVYGYKRKPIIDHNRFDEYGRPLIVEVDREIDEEQARWVVQIFEWFVEGHPPLWIAHRLNSLGVPAPRGDSWARSAIYGDMKRDTGLLNNQLYIGKAIWNRREWHKTPDGKRIPVARDMTEYVVKERPDLRIISDELWQKKCERQKAIRHKSVKLQETLSKSTGAGPKYLLSGLLKCGCCGSNYTIIGKTYYGCGKYRDRGPAACKNNITVKKEVLEDVLLKGIRNELFSKKAMGEFLKQCNRIMHEIEASYANERKETEKRLKQIDVELKNLLGFIKEGKALSSITNEIKSAEDEKRRLELLLKTGPANSAEIMNIIPGALERYKATVHNLGNIEPDKLAEAREKIRTIAGGGIKLTPYNGDGLEAEIEGSYCNLITDSSIMLVAGGCNGHYRTKFIVRHPTNNPTDFKHAHLRLVS